MARAARAAVSIRIANSRAVVIDGRLREAGELVEVPNSEAALLIRDGYAVTEADWVAALEDHAEVPAGEGEDDGIERDTRGRRVLTAAAIRDGEAELGR